MEHSLVNHLEVSLNTFSATYLWLSTKGIL
jgi:hypothetical protein